jgi:hypothetical protein
MMDEFDGADPGATRAISGRLRCLRKDASAVTLSLTSGRLAAAAGAGAPSA